MKALLNWRCHILFILGLITICGIFSVPDDRLSMVPWILSLIISKLIGFAGGYSAYRLISYWGRKGLIPELTKFIINDQ